MNFLKPDKAGVLKVLQRIALHHPRSKQITALDILAEDYAKACQDMTMGQFEAAAMEANANSGYFPVIKQIREAHEKLCRQTPVELRAGAEEAWTPEHASLSRERAKEVIEALRTGIKPAWMRQ